MAFYYLQIVYFLEKKQKNVALCLHIALFHRQANRQLKKQNMDLGNMESADSSQPSYEAHVGTL